MVMWHYIRQYSKTVMLAALFALASGCTAPLWGDYGPVGHSREEFEHYVEEVFRFQNKMTSEVMMLLETGEAGSHERLLQAEQHMHQICEPLDEYVSRDMDGLSTGFLLRRQVMKSTLDCDHAAHEVKALLDQL